MYGIAKWTAVPVVLRGAYMLQLNFNC